MASKERRMTPNPMVFAQVGDGNRTSVTVAPEVQQRSWAARHKKGLGGLAAALLFVGCVAGILLFAHRRSRIQVPERFTASYVVTDANPANPKLYGNLVKTPGASSGVWVVSGYVESVQDGTTSRYTYTDDRAYFQSIEDATGKVLEAGCLGPADVPPIQGLGASLGDSSVLEPQHASSAVTAACGESELHSFKFFGQVYVYCEAAGNHVLVGSSFRAQVVSLDTQEDTHVSIPNGVDGSPLECPVLGVAASAPAAATHRRMNEVAEQEVWHLAGGEAGAAGSGRRLQDNPDGCCRCRRRLWYEEVADESGQRRLNWVPATAASIDDAGIKFPGVTVPSTMSVVGVYTPDVKVCICCSLPGIESSGPLILPPECNKDSIQVTLDVSKPWDDPDQLDSLCDQLAGGHDGNMLPTGIQIFAQSTGNYALAKAVLTGRCRLPRESSMFWTMVEGILGVVGRGSDRNPGTYGEAFQAEDYCDDYTRRDDFYGAENMCAQKGNTWEPTPAANALEPSYFEGGNADVMPFVTEKVDSVVKSYTQFGAGLYTHSTPPELAATQAFLGDKPPYTITTAIEEEGTAVIVQTSATGHDDPTSTGMWGPISYSATGATGSSTVGYTRRLGAVAQDAPITPMPRTWEGGMSTIMQFYEYAAKHE